MCKILIENGALFNLYDSYNKTPIHYACTNNFSELVYYFYEVFIETDTDEKICDNLTNNKEIDSLFQNYLSNHRDKKTHLSNLENINKQLQNKHEKNYFLENRKIKPVKYSFINNKQKNVKKQDENFVKYELDNFL